MRKNFGLQKTVNGTLQTRPARQQSMPQTLKPGATRMTFHHGRGQHFFQLLAHHRQRTTCQLTLAKDHSTTHTPTDFLALSTANLPTPTIQDPTDYFNAMTYPGNGTAIGSGGKAVSGVGHQPDLVWIKNRDAADQHILTDSVRGADEVLVGRPYGCRGDGSRNARQL